VTRVPVVYARPPRAGASTLAAALHATEPIAAGCAADIAVCAGDEPSLRRAETAQRAEALLVVAPSARGPRATGTPVSGRADECPIAARPAPATPAFPLVLDDDALEAEVLAAVARRLAPSIGTARLPIPHACPLPAAAQPSSAAHAARTAATAHPLSGGAVGPACVAGGPAVRPRIRARHQPVVGDVRVPTARAG
jgi:hypothetical protein